MCGKGLHCTATEGDEILDLKEPTSVEELQSIIGIFSYVTEGIHRFAHKVAPLRALLARCLEMDGHGRSQSPETSPATSSVLPIDQKTFPGEISSSS